MQASGGYGTGAVGGTGAVAGFDSGAPPVVVHARQKVGDYETVTIGAGDAGAAVAWLNDEGFIVNASMGAYMQPYLDDGMLFLASKLRPNADVDELRPLQMRYAGDTPAIPLRLTAVAAEPHLTVTALIYADGPYEPFGHPIIDIDDAQLGSPDGLADNYPSALARLVDEAGGDGFALEYYGPPPTYQEPSPQCCASGVTPDGGIGAVDFCSLGGNGSCECPLADFDADDCGGETGPAAGIALVEALAARHTRVTRLTTRLSADEMTFDPVFRPMWGDEPVTGRRSHRALHQELSGCAGDVVEPEVYAAVVARQGCAAVYCGIDAECAVTESGVGCVCGPTELARMYTDLDGRESVTCVPQQGTVDFSAGGLELPDACAGQPLTGGAECFDIGGFPTVLCPEGQAAVADGGAVPGCEAVVAGTGGPGARNYTGDVDDIDVCAPRPPRCPAHGWLVERAVSNPGVACEGSTPDPSWLVVPPAPTCDDYGYDMQDTQRTRVPPRDVRSSVVCGCRAVGGQPDGSAPAGGLGLLLLSVIGLCRQRGRRRLRRRRSSARDTGCAP